VKEILHGSLYRQPGTSSAKFVLPTRGSQSRGERNPTWQLIPRHRKKKVNLCCGQIDDWRGKSAYGGEAADAEAARRRRDLDDLERVLVLLLLLPLPLPVPAAVPVLPAHHRETRLQL
jgi:hypothetical protein